MAETAGDPNDPVEPSDPLAPFQARDATEGRDAAGPASEFPRPPASAYARSAGDPDDLVHPGTVSHLPAEPANSPAEAAEFEQPVSMEPRPLPVPPPISAPTEVSYPPPVPPAAAASSQTPPPGFSPPPPPPAAFAGGPAFPPPAPSFGGGQGVPPLPPPFPPAPALSQPPSTERYPAWFDVEYHQPLSRLSTLFRAFLIIPGFLMLSALNYAIVLFIVVARVAIIFRRKYPVWMYSAVAGFLAWHGRLYAYTLLLTDQFPSLSTEPQNAVKLGYDVPEQGTFSRWNGLLWRSIICIPHFIAVGFLLVVVVPIVTVIAWFAILFTGAYPRGIFNFVTGVVRWWFRVTSYVFLLQDRFPPFGLSATETRSSQGAITASAIGGSVLAAGFAAITIFAFVSGSRPYVEEISYASLAEEADSVTTRIVSFGGDDGPPIEVTLTYVLDPGEDFIPILIPSRDERVVVFEWDLRNRRNQRVSVSGDVAWFTVEYKDDDGDDRTESIPATIVTVTNSAPPVAIASGDRVFIYAVFVVPEDAEPVSLRFRTSDGERPIRYDFD